MVRKLATMSRRLQFVLAITLCFALFLVAIVFFSGRRVLTQEYAGAQYHFEQLVGRLKSHEDFLGLLDRESERLMGDVGVYARQIRRLPSPQEGQLLYEARERRSSTPFIFATDRTSGPLDGDLALGIAAADLYSNYWTTSIFPGAQSFLFSLENSDAFAIPCLPATRGHKEIQDLCNLSLEQARQIVVGPARQLALGAVGWLSVTGIGDHPEEPNLVAYRRIELDPAFRLVLQHPSREYAAASVLDAHHFATLGKTLDHNLVQGFELYTPDGTALMPSIVSETRRLHDGVNFNPRAIVFRFSKADGWSGLYRIPYGNLLYLAQFHIIVALGLMLVSAAACIIMFRRHTRAVVVPAQQSHERMVESEGFSRTIVDSAQIGVCVISDNNEVLSANGLARTWLGSEVRPEVLARAGEREEEPTQPGHQIYRLTVGGKTLCIDAARTRYEGRNAILYTLRDITPFIDVAQALTDAKTAAEHANAAKTVFLSTMSHEIRTPLYGVLGTLELLAYTDLDAQQCQYVRTIEQASGTLLHVISDVLDVAKIEAGQLVLAASNFDPLSLTEEVLRSYSALARTKGVKIYAMIDPGVPRNAQGDVFRLKQVLSNLLNNAIKFTEQGRVTLSLDAVVGPASASFQWRVVDTGAGISEQDQARLFEPFFQCGAGQAGVGKGTGLGLSICKRIADLMAGRIDVGSQLGVGTSFTFEVALPLGDGEAPAAEALALEPATILIRAPLRELAGNVAKWVEHWGGKAVQASSTEIPGDVAIVIDIFPDHLPPIQWQGARIVCLPDGPDAPQRSRTGFILGMASIQGIGRAIQQLQSGAAASVDADILPSDVAQPGAAVLADAQRRKIEDDMSRLSLRVLVAEDNAINQALLAKQLKSLGCDAVIVGDGEEALRRWGREPFDILLTDINMPGLDGLSLAARLRAGGESRPIIGITANAINPLEEQPGSPVSAWLVKPFGIAQLRERIRAACVNSMYLRHAETRESPSEIINEADLFEGLQSVFMVTVQEDMAAARDALLRRDRYVLRTMMHRLCGGLAVAQFTDISRSCQILEMQLNESEINVAIETAVKSTLGEIEKILASMGHRE